MQSSQLINLSVLSARWLQDHSWYKAASVSSLQPSPTQMEHSSWAEQIFISKPQLAVALDLVNSCWGIQPVGKLGGQHVCPSTLPAASSQGTVGGLQSSDFPPWYNWFCVWMREGKRGDTDLRQDCVARGVHLPLFQRYGCPVRGNRCFGGHRGWCREGRKTSVVGNVQLKDSGANLYLTFSCSWNMFFITSGHAAGAVLGQIYSAPWNMLLPYLC